MRRLYVLLPTEESCKAVVDELEGSGIPQTLIALADPGSSLSNRLLSMRMVDRYTWMEPI